MVEVRGNPFVVGGDTIVALNGTKIADLDALSSYLQERTVPSQTLVVQIIRSGRTTTVNLVLGMRPPAPSG